MSFETIPPTLTHYRVPSEVIVETETFLRMRGKQGHEAVILWLGHVVDRSTGEITSAYAPQQLARRSEAGVSVEVTQEGLAVLISALSPGEFVLARVHSHPGEAYHSDLDDANLLVSHQGAISIVVPDFAADHLNLAECSVNELRHGEGWRELRSSEVAERFRVQ